MFVIDCFLIKCFLYFISVTIEDEMKFANCFCLGLLVCDVFAQGGNTFGDDSGPEIYADISKKAQQNAIKYDGLKILGGLTYSMASFDATIRTGSSRTKQNVNNFMLTLGLDYSKKFKKSFIVGGMFLLDFWKAQKKSGDMQIFNYDYYDRNLVSWASLYNTLSGELKTPCMTPELAIKGGYIFRNMGTIAFLKLGVQRMKAEYIYYVDGIKISSVKAIKYIPLFGIGGHKRFNKKLGVSFELNFPFKREYEGETDYGSKIYHKVKMGRTTVRVLATYSIPGKTN